MKYSVILTARAKKQLAKLDKPVAKLITSWLMKNLQGCENPRQHGKGLTANRSGQWRYRVGDYRLIADIQDDKVIIMIVEIGHRSTVPSVYESEGREFESLPARQRKQVLIRVPVFYLPNSAEISVNTESLKPENDCINKTSAI